MMRLFFLILIATSSCCSNQFNCTPFRCRQIDCRTGICKSEMGSPCREMGMRIPPLGEGVQIVDYLPFSEVIIPFALELQHTRRLRFEDSKIYYDGGGVLRFRVIFSTQLHLELCESRELMVTVVEGLLSRLNADPRILESFDHEPVTAIDLELYFSYESYMIEYVDPQYIAWMSLHDGFVRYYDGVLKNMRIDFWNGRIEPYYKSLEFVQIAKGAQEEYEREHPVKKHKSGIRSLE